MVLGSFRRAVAGPHRPLHCLGFIQFVQSVRSRGWRATADGMGRGGRRRREREREEEEDEEEEEESDEGSWMMSRDFVCE